MSIVPLLKVSLIGVLEDKSTVLEAAQAFGHFHLIPLSSAQKELEVVPSGHGKEAVEALRWLTDAPAQRRTIEDREDFDLSDIIAKASKNQRQLKEAEDTRARLVKRIKDVEPWGEFSFTDLAAVGDYRLWFYIVPKSKLKLIDPSDKILEVVHEDRYRCYIVLLSPDEPAPDAMPVPRIHVGEESLSTLQKNLETVEVELEDLELERQVLTKWRGLLAKSLATAKDTSARHRAALETLDEDRVFVLQAWARSDEQDAILDLAREYGIAVQFEEPTEADNPPTLLENPAGLRAGEDLVEFYQTPGYRSWDPSIVVYISFILFFGMIMTDAGYGLLLLALLFLFRKRFSSFEAGPRLFRMSIWLMVSTTVFGVATGSYFGLEPPPNSFLGHLKFLQLDDVDTMMKLTLTIGVIHIVAANLFHARHAETHFGRIQPFGWMAVAVGGLVSYLGSGSGFMTIGLVLVVGGLLTVGFFASDRKVTSVKTAALRVFDGFTAVSKVVNIFSDVLSYMRLFALGLAAASLAQTINDLSHQLFQAVPGIGLLIAIAVLVLGHAINIALGLIAGVVHGLRLNVIEFFNWGLEDEGTPFRPFKKEETRL